MVYLTWIKRWECKISIECSFAIPTRVSSQKLNKTCFAGFFSLKLPLWLIPLKRMIHSPSLLEDVLSLIMAWGICLMTLLLPVGLHISYCIWQILDCPQGTYQWYHLVCMYVFVHTRWHVHSCLRCNTYIQTDYGEWAWMSCQWNFQILETHYATNSPF